MFTVSMTSNNVFIMKEEEDIEQGFECALEYNDSNDNSVAVNFIEKDGLYAYSEFFSEGDWSDKYYLDGDGEDDEEQMKVKRENAEKYDGLKLKWVRGGWMSMTDLISAIDYPKINKKPEDFEEKLADSIKILKERAKTKSKEQLGDEYEGEEKEYKEDDFTLIPIDEDDEDDEDEDEYYNNEYIQISF